MTATAATPEVCLRVKSPDGTRVVVIAKPLFTIGRRAVCDLQLASADVSRDHADIVHEGPPALPLLRKLIKGNVDLETKRRAEKLVEEAKEAIQRFGPKAQVLKQLANYIIDRDH